MTECSLCARHLVSIVQRILSLTCKVHIIPILQVRNAEAQQV